MDFSKINQRHKGVLNSPTIIAEIFLNLPIVAILPRLFLYSGFLNISEFKLSIIVPNELFPLIAIILESIVCSEHDF